MKTLHALLVGINAYPQSPLRGCVPDALAIGEFFQNHCRKNDLHWRPRYLLAPHPYEAEALRVAADELDGVGERGLPTRQGLIDAFDHLQGEAVQPGDLILFYFSGHGSQEPATPEFAHLKADGMNETLVCLDSRNGSRDLLDKELAYLLARVHRNQPNAHLLVISDSCHSGNGTRGPAEAVRVRRERANYKTTPFAELLGVQGVPPSEWVFNLVEGRAFYTREARHIQLAGARDGELAKEMAIDGEQRGVFTHSLLRVLNDGGAGMTYADIARRTGAMVRNRVSDQIPQADAWAAAELNAGFLNGSFRGNPMEFPVFYEKRQWVLKGGALQGVVPGTPERPLFVRIGERTVRVQEVLATFSVLDAPDNFFTDAEKSDARNGKLLGVVQEMNAPSIRIHVDISDAALRENLLSSIAEAELLYCNVHTPTPDEADYLVRTDEQGRYMLLKKDGNYPVFMRQENAGAFLTFCDQVGKWRFVQEMEKPLFAGLRPEDIDIQLEILEDISPDTINMAAGRPVSRDAVELQYIYSENPAGEITEKVPALRCTVRINKPGLFVGGLFLDNEHGVTLTLNPTEAAPGKPYTFDFQNEGATYTALPLLIKTQILNRGVRRITEHLKLFISTDFFDLNNLAQAALPVDEFESVSRGPGFGQTRGSVKPDWCVMTIPVHISCPSAAVDLHQLSGAGFRITQAPPGFSASVTLCSAAEAKRSLAGAGTRSADPSLERSLLPPASLWGDAEMEGAVFTRSMEIQHDEALSILQLTDVFGELTEPLILGLDEKAGPDEVIIPFGYDAETELYLPMGYTNEEGDVEIVSLPDPTPGVLGAHTEDMQSRGIITAVKLFFKKMKHRKLPNTLALIRHGEEPVTDPEQVRRVVSEARSILFITHGNIINTEDKIEAMTRIGAPAHFDAFLLYTYESLNTPIEKTAADLLARLKDAGACIPEKGARLTMVAPSMGGLVCRWMVEQLDGAPFVAHLMLVGSPSLGSDLATVRKRLFGLLGRALNGIPLLKPYILPLSLLTKGLGKALFVTMNQQEPGSDFLKALNNPLRKPDGVRYSLLGGDIALLDQLENQESGRFWKRFKRFVTRKALDWFVFDEPHDTLVEVSSQKGPAGMIAEQQARIIAADHLSYFVEERATAVFREKLLDEQV